jgi:hypothetical protein
MRRAALIAILLLTGCGNFDPFATPFVPRPQLPLSNPFPNDVETVLEELDALGLRCQFVPDSDIPGGWRCSSQGPDMPNEGISLSLGGPEDGPITGAWAMMGMEDRTKDELDAIATEMFLPVVIGTFVPEHLRPTEDEFFAMVAANWPVELGEGWFIGFDRNSGLRTTYLVFTGEE